MALLPEDQNHDIEHPHVGKDVDLHELATVLSEALIARLTLFRPSQRRKILRAVRARLMQEGGIYREFCTGMWGT